jgi:hypothetical protein
MGGGAWTLTTDLRIMSRRPATDSTQVQHDGSANSGATLQNPPPAQQDFTPQGDDVKKNVS